MTASWRMVVLAGLLAAPAAAARAAPGESKAAAQAAARERAALIQGLPRGKAFRSGGKEYRIVGGLRAVARPPQAPAHEALAAVGSAPADLLEDKGPFLVFREGTGGAPLAAVATSGRGETLPVAVNTRTGGLGVVLGSIAVRLRDAAAGEALARDLGLERVAATPRLSMAFYRVPRGADLRAAAARLARDRRVRSAEIEVREHFDVPM